MTEPDPEPPQQDDSRRHETELERYDRNWAEILQELRVTQMGTQILTGFLLAAAFQAKIDELTPFQQTTYLVLVVLGVTTTALGLVPVSLHRTLFRHGMKKAVVDMGHRILWLVMVGVGLMLSGTAILIFDLVLGTPWSLVAGAYVLIALVAFVLVPRAIYRRPEPDSQARSDQA
ncbi:DUF6328 family protein [Ornithinimicrobium cryptoxanthini]|uniref:DUF6328 family protein n=1 Tax=Ornithinimicrobium cryptoxanthini TaxID=2934161 RepID=UPI00211821A8|nr:DUF6328 family protein [Ornithinimicrobium cryptoxanthini]